jgi:hypothetical protein
MANHGWRWFGSSDPWHFDFTQGGVALTGLSTRAFQRLWNANNPNDRISEDGRWGPQTASRLARSPAAGFRSGATCKAPTPVAPTPDPVAPTPTYQPLEVYWARQADGSYNLRALAPSAVTRVEYYVDNFLITQGSREDGVNFPASYSFSVERSERLFEVRGFDERGTQIALGVGLLDVTDGVAVYIRQMGQNLYEIGLERASLGVASIEVRADGTLLTDGLSASTRSPRNAVRSNFNQLGPRAFELTTYNADGSLRGSLRRTFTLR